ncbi:MAG: hypothetical protein WHS90_05810 [Caldilinea sp.]|jgi:ketosteroid isomerase-like protein|uniref:YybH family protein n=1 Tax=Caldilinea sp. TaxID=2293560 RepID=UPI0030A016AE
MTLWRRILLFFYASLTLSGCSAPASSTDGSCSLNLPSSTDDATVIRVMIAAEGQLVVAQEIDALMALWSEDGYVADARHTPDQPEDDQHWRGVDAIRHRYVRVVFPGAPTNVTPSDMEVEIAGDRAVVTATTRIGAEIAPGGDRWTLVRQNGCWLFESLTYNLEPRTP